MIMSMLKQLLFSGKSVGKLEICLRKNSRYALRVDSRAKSKGSITIGFCSARVSRDWSIIFRNIVAQAAPILSACWSIVERLGIICSRSEEHTSELQSRE